MPRNKILDNKNAIINTAFQIMDREGPEALSARRISKEIGVSAMTLYNYVRNIDDIRREILIRGFNLLYEKLYCLVKSMEEQDISWLAALARAYAMTLYDFSREHRYLCAYLLGEGRIRFSGDAELRPFYHVFGGFLPSGASGREKELRLTWRMFEGMLTAMIYENSSGIRPLPREELMAAVDLFLEKVFD